MANLARQEMYVGRFFTLDEVVASVESVTAEAIQSIARTFFDTSRIALTVLGNLENLRIGRDDLAC
jgi:predicted Zn-dependent peptidase